MTTKSEDLSELIIKTYSSFGYKAYEQPSSQVIKFDNLFSIHFVFLFDSVQDCRDKWENEHRRYLIEDYENYRCDPEKKKPDLEWNYYAVFFIVASQYDYDDLTILRNLIQKIFSYSRKFVMSDKDIKKLPPGIIRLPALLHQNIGHQEPLIKSWEKTLGSPLFNSLFDNPESEIEKELRLQFRVN